MSVCLSVCPSFYFKISSFIVIKRRTLFECQCISHERSNWGQYCLYFSYWRRGRHFTRSSELHEGLTVCKAKAVPPLLWVFVRSRESNPRPPAQALFRLSLSCRGNLRQSSTFFYLFLLQSNVPWNHLVPLLICNQNAGGWLWCGAAEGGVQGMPAWLVFFVIVFYLFVCF